MKDNFIEFRVYGKRALFTNPVSKIGGEKRSYPIPTYEALKGIVESIYWKPTISWVIDKVRIMNPIREESVGVKPIKMSGGNELALYTYLYDVSYQVMCHFVWNTNRDDLINDRNENKHYFSAMRMVERGGRRDVFLGTRECPAYVVPCKFGEGEGAYDNSQKFEFDLMYHGIDYPSKDSNEIWTRFWKPVMEKGVIDFILPSECEILKKIRDGSYTFNPSSGIEDALLQLPEVE